MASGGGGSVRSYALTVTTTGGAGAATGSAVTSQRIEGYLLDVYLDYHASAPNTTDVTCKQTDRSDSFLVVTNSATDKRYTPRVQVCDAAGADIVGGHDLYWINGTITVSVAESNALTGACVATVRVHTL